VIFVTVGGQKPFDRLIECVDAWAEEQGLAKDAVFAQIGKGARTPRHIEWTESLDPGEYKRCVARARVIVSHAGMGTILTAVDEAVPILVMPRIARLAEHRNDHQLATARQLTEVIGLPVAWDEHELRDWLGRLDELEPRPAHGEGLRDLTRFVREFIDS
jgi:UDP-N-acetylglucosamine transferase subunit ALG13